MAFHEVEVEIEPGKPRTNDNVVDKTVEADDEASAIEEARKTYPSSKITYKRKVRD